MNIQTQIPGQISSQVPNQAGNQMPGLTQQNGNSFHTQAPVLGGQSNPTVMDPEVIRMRYFMRDKIFEMLMRRQSQPTDMVSKRIQDISRRLEEGLFKLASTKEEYMNMNTLESRLQAFIKRAPQNHQAPQTHFMNSSTPIGTMIPTPGTMIPTPGMHVSGNSNMTASSVADPSIISTSGTMSSSVLSSGSMIPNTNGSFPTMSGGSFHAAEGSLSNNFHQSPSSFSANSGGNNLMASVRPSSQMIPTPGYNSTTTTHAVTNVDISGNDGVFSSVDSSVVPRKNGGQNSRLLQNVGSVFGSGVRSLMQQRFQNGSMSSGYVNNPQMFNGSTSSVSYLTSTSYSASSSPLQHPLGQHQRPAMQGDGNKLGAAISTETNLSNPVLPVGSMIDNQNINQARSQSVSTGNLLANSQSNMQTDQLRPQLAEQIERSDFQPIPLSRDDRSQSSMMQYQQQSHDLQQQQKHQFGASHSSQQRQAFAKNNTFVQSQMESNVGIAHQNEVLQPKVPSEQLQYSELRHSSEQTINGNQMMPNIQPESLLTSQWHPQSDVSSLSGNLSHEQNLQQDLHQRIVGHDEAQHNNMSCEVTAQTVSSRNADAIRERQFRNQQRWILFLRHARYCKSPQGKCPERNCHIVQTLVKHIDGCSVAGCSYPRCYHSKRIVHHYKNCRDSTCPVCVPVRNFIRTRSKQCVRPPDSEPGFSGLVSGSHIAGPKETPKPSEIAVETSEHPSVKRLKVERVTESVMAESGTMLLPETDTSLPDSHDVLVKEVEKNDKHLQLKSEFPDVKAEISCGSIQSATEVNNGAIDSSFNQMQDSGPTLNNDFGSSAKEEHVKDEKDVGEIKSEEVVQPSEPGVGTKSGKPMIKGVSLTELFTPEQIREHIASLRQWVGQSKVKVEKIQALEHSMSENSCQLCAVEKLTFEPPPIYCSPCGARIKRNAMYYTGGAGETRHYFCIPCYNEARGDTISVDGANVSKSRLEKKKNDEETEEWWVQCDKCEAWQHQICALFNGRRNDGGQAEYTCPNCYIEEIERGERTPLPQSALLGAKDLPRTILSDHIEQRLFRRLRLERQERARVQGKSYDEVPGADGIVVRVVSSVDKKLEVKPRFLEIFRDDNYPMEFPYKSKVVLLFQKIEGVEVCLFGMYVQEFGSECQQPNQRRVYLSYLDSVKYFRPDVRTVTGEALRTFVYHEILIGYLEYCKLRGFTSCYIWACPPLKGEDYILYCHPEIQKTPKSDKLREWYLSMLRKATKENIVVELTNLYDHFFIQSGECKAKVTAARLPYFDGDYWPGAAEDMIYQIYQEEECRKQNKKGTTKKMFTKRALKASGQSDLSTNASKDILLMHKLGETISPMKEDFIMVHLQHACTHCCLLMVSGNRWVCNQCKNFQLCDKCYDVEQKRDDRERHPTNQKDKHALYRVEIIDVPEDTKDKDDILESEFFDTRQAFLSLCQGNHYQYDTLRRAKHSSMMVLYHLHNPTAPAFVTTCNICHLDIETGQGWRCETCPDYDVCNTCYQKDGGIDHPHKLTNHPSLAERDAQNKEARQLRVLQLRKMLDLLVHASICRSPQCQYPNCRKVKGLFRHGIHCRVRASGGCFLCKKMWYLLQLHARACKESQCHVPRCRDLKEHLRRLQQQSDSRRRAAVMEMMRQRAAEVANNN